MTTDVRSRGAALACMTLATATLAAGPAPAQDEGTFLGGLICGAGRQKVAIDTPQAVTAREQEDIDREQAASVGQILRNVPGAQIGGSDRPLGFAFNIRGIGATERSASEARIIGNVDGLPRFYEQCRLGSFFSDPALYRRVAVLRGSGSATLYGSGAIGGVVNLETKDASDFIPEGGRTVTDRAAALTLAALHDITDDLSVFGTVARTERLPMPDELYSVSTTKAPALELEKEEATTIEFGLA